MIARLYCLWFLSLIMLTLLTPRILTLLLPY